MFYSQEDNVENILYVIFYTNFIMEYNEARILEYRSYIQS